MALDLPNDILIQAIEHSNLAHTISRLDGDMELLYVNQAFLDSTGYKRNEVEGRNCRFLQGEGTKPETVPCSASWVNDECWAPVQANSRMARKTETSLIQTVETPQRP